jgi:23S rRNA-/tRNA-specific pseudouridylate synthase
MDSVRDNKPSHEISRSQPRQDSKPKRNRKRQRKIDTEEVKIEATVEHLNLSANADDDNKDNSNNNNNNTLANAPLVRWIQPYFYTFTTHAKARWVGRTVLDIYTTEFGSYPRDYYEAAIRQGRIQVCNATVDPSYIIQNQDVLSHTVHRHEPAVTVTSKAPPHVTILADTDSLVAVDKPGTLPVHPCGGYHQNSLIKLLEPVYGKLYNVNRLDRLTSGLVILAKTSSGALEWTKAIKARDACEKLYLARVKGLFPLNLPHSIPLLSDSERKFPVHGEWDVDGSCLELDALTLRLQHAHGYWMSAHSTNGFVNTVDTATNSTNTSQERTALEDFASRSSPVHSYLKATDISESDEKHAVRDVTWLHLCCPVRVEQPKHGICKCGTFTDLDDAKYSATVKSAQTSFALVHYDVLTDSSILLCRPLTGRTHQIRLHLEYMQHPIANDPNYGGDMWYGNAAGKDVCDRASQLLRSNASRIEYSSVEDRENVAWFHQSIMCMVRPELWQTWREGYAGIRSQKSRHLVACTTIHFQAK